MRVQNIKGEKMKRMTRDELAIKCTKLEKEIDDLNVNLGESRYNKKLLIEEVANLKLELHNTLERERITILNILSSQFPRTFRREGDYNTGKVDGVEYPDFNRGLQNNNYRRFP